MARNQGNRSTRGNERSAFGWTETAREKPLATAAAVGAAAAAGAFLWSRRNQISEQISNLSDQFSEWTENMGSGRGREEFELESTSGGMGASMTTGTKSRTGGTRSTGTSRRSIRGATGLSETGGGNANLGARSGGGGMSTSASGRGRARQSPTS